ncbi:fluconazole resistance protein 3 [Trichoderma asperellum]|uniref:Fluconazole resistance protein 3 n=1 Tax=Trichoderma asperellum TaxID=101201 RepID=A0A6V8QRS9_TRIAP|nr:hypothetical protein LI328DRAFT_107152 [Trichoderma asperelloides]GFP53173.1 fluconazole resistance protein 3 [Trichoderma asperellum]
MDFAAQYAFAGPHQAFPASFMPLTPSHSQSNGSDDFSNTSPPDNFADHFNTFDYTGSFGGHHQHHQSTFHQGPPSPPVFGQHPRAAVQQQPNQEQQQHISDHLAQSPSTNGSINGGSGAKIEANSDDIGRGGSEDEDMLTPAQSRRKAQNRAAQRAFRERKERHVKDLESKLANLEAAQKEAATENERLRRDLQRMSTENEILRATSAMNQNNGSHSPEPLTTGPMTYTPTDFYTNVLQGHNNKFPSHRIVTSDDGHRLLAAGAAWDFILAHPLYKRGLVDVSQVAERMKRLAKCDGQGPVFSEGDIIHAIEQSVASGSDDLL